MGWRVPVLRAARPDSREAHLDAVRVTVLVGTATVTHQGARLVDQVIEVGTFVGHGWGLSHGHGHRCGTSRE
jgi:hypothetical protein